MKKLLNMIVLVCVVAFTSCGSYEVQCENSPLVPYFKGFQPADIDTLIIRRFAANGSFTQQLDSTFVAQGYTSAGYYSTQHDTTIVRFTRLITAGSDWQIFIPAKNRTVNISAINGEGQHSVKCNKGLFSMDKTGCYCNNAVYSYKQNNQTISFNSSNFTDYVLYIQ